jgi:hypothetical protein
MKTFLSIFILSTGYLLAFSQVNIDDIHNRSGKAPSGTVTVNFSYTGSEQTWTVPAGVTSISIEAWGAQGGTYGNAGGLGGYATGGLNVSSGQVIYIYVGQQPSNHLGGYNGGGAGHSDNYSRGGGGATDIRVSGTTLNHRVIVQQVEVERQIRLQSQEGPEVVSTVMMVLGQRDMQVITFADMELLRLPEAQEV